MRRARSRSRPPVERTPVQKYLDEGLFRKDAEKAFKTPDTQKPPEEEIEKYQREKINELIALSTIRGEVDKDLRDALYAVRNSRVKMHLRAYWEKMNSQLPPGWHLYSVLVGSTALLTRPPSTTVRNIYATTTYFAFKNKRAILNATIDYVKTAELNPSNLKTAAVLLATCLSIACWYEKTDDVLRYIKTIASLSSSFGEKMFKLIAFWAGIPFYEMRSNNALWTTDITTKEELALTMATFVMAIIETDWFKSYDGLNTVGFDGMLRTLYLSHGNADIVRVGNALVEAFKTPLGPIITFKWYIQPVIYFVDAVQKMMNGKDPRISAPTKIDYALLFITFINYFFEETQNRRGMLFTSFAISAGKALTKAMRTQSRITILSRPHNQRIQQEKQFLKFYNSDGFRGNIEGQGLPTSWSSGNLKTFLEKQTCDELIYPDRFTKFLNAIGAKDLCNSIQLNETIHKDEIVMLDAKRLAEIIVNYESLLMDIAAIDAKCRACYVSPLAIGDDTLAGTLAMYIFPVAPTQYGPTPQLYGNDKPTPFGQRIKEDNTVIPILWSQLCRKEYSVDVYDESGYACNLVTYAYDPDVLSAGGDLGGVVAKYGVPPLYSGAGMLVGAAAAMAAKAYRDYKAGFSLFESPSRALRHRVPVNVDCETEEMRKDKRGELNILGRASWFLSPIIYVKSQTQRC